MKYSIIFLMLFLFIGGILSVQAQDLIVLKDGNVIEARITELSPTEIRYRRFEQLSGPIIVIPADQVLSVRYEDGTVDLIDAPKSRSFGMDPDKFNFGIQLEPLGFAYSGPSISLELTRAWFNVQLNFRIPALGQNSSKQYFRDHLGFENALIDGYATPVFGWGFAVNLLHHTRFGAFYMGIMADFSIFRYEDVKHWGYVDNVWTATEWDEENSNGIIAAMAMGYKLILPSGIAFHAGFFYGLESHKGDKYIFRPLISFGYVF